MARVEGRNSEGLELSMLNRPEFAHLEREWAFLPFSDFKRWIPEDDPWIEFEQSFPVDRLGGVKQLSFLSYAGPAPESVFILQHPHTRLLHTQQVAMIGREIVKRNGGDTHSQLLMMTAGGIHDIATVAHGDATKLVDPKALHEEDHWKKVVGKSGRAFLKKHTIAETDIDDIVHNKGVYGKILDVADRIAYVMEDTYETASGMRDPIRVDPYTAVLEAIMTRDKKLGNIYKDVLVDWRQEEVVFANKDRLANFLYLRAHLHKAHYMYPENQGRDLFVSSLIKPFYSTNEDDVKQGLLTPGVLRSVRDEELIDYLREKYGFDRDLYLDILNWHPKYEIFTTEVEARQREYELAQNTSNIIVGVRESVGFNPATNYLVLDGNSYDTFHNLDGRAVAIEELANGLKGFSIFYTPAEHEPISSLMHKAHKFTQSKVNP